MPQAGCPEFLSQSTALALRKKEEIGPEHTDLLPSGFVRIDWSGSWWRCGVEQLAVPRHPPGSSAHVRAFPRMRNGDGFSPSCKLPLLVGKQQMTAHAVDPHLRRSRSCGGKERGTVRPRAGGSSAGPSGASLSLAAQGRERSLRFQLTTFLLPKPKVSVNCPSPSLGRTLHITKEPPTNCLVSSKIHLAPISAKPLRCGELGSTRCSAVPPRGEGRSLLLVPRTWAAVLGACCVGTSQQYAGSAKGRQASRVRWHHGDAWGRGGS